MQFGMANVQECSHVALFMISFKSHQQMTCHIASKIPFESVHETENDNHMKHVLV